MLALRIFAMVALAAGASAGPVALSHGAELANLRLRGGTGQVSPAAVLHQLSLYVSVPTMLALD